jgi:hypothetical protein
VRLPLQAGNSALNSLLKASALLVPGSIVTLAALWLVIEIDLGDDISMWILALPAAVLYFAWRNLMQAREMRPSDLIFEVDSFRVVGGKLDGRSVQWSRIETIELYTRPDDEKKKPQKLEILKAPEVGPDPDDVVELQLLIGKERLVLAATEDGIELPSLHELAGALENGRTAKKQPQEKHEAPPEVLRCPGCTAPVRPSVNATTRCSFCGQEVEVAQALREKLIAAQLESRRPARLVASVLRQPSARFVGGMYAFSAIFMLAAWPVALGVLFITYEREAFRFSTLGYVVLFLCACLLGFFGLIRGWLTDRHALRAIATGFAAIKPRDEKAPLQCRACFGPLPEDRPLALVRCAYCSAPNLLTGDFVPRRAQLEDERSSLERALAVRTRERRRWRGAALAGVLLVGLSGWALKKSLSAPPQPPVANRETETPR